MPLIKITDESIAKSKPPSSGWNLVKIEKFSESDSADKKSKNMVFDLVIIRSPQGEDQLGRYCYARFNTKAVGMLVSSGFLSACYERDITEAFEFNPEDLYGKEVWCETKDDVYQGRVQKKTELFAPPTNPPF